MNESLSDRSTRVGVGGGDLLVKICPSLKHKRVTRRGVVDLVNSCVSFTSCFRQLI